jgi:hypothetical protein
MVEHQCADRDVPVTDYVLRSLCHSVGKYMDVSVYVYAYNVVLNYTHYSAPLSTLDEDIWKITEHSVYTQCNSANTDFGTLLVGFQYIGNQLT